MYEKLRLCWEIIVDDIVEEGQVDAARSYIGDNQDTSYARPEFAAVDAPCCLHTSQFSQSLCMIAIWLLQPLLGSNTACRTCFKGLEAGDTEAQKLICTHTHSMPLSRAQGLHVQTWSIWP